MTEPIGVEPGTEADFSDYRIEALVGRGGMGVVYRAYDVRLKRNVALKLVAPEYASDERFRDRFLAETERAASLEHPAVVPIYDAGEVDGRLYLAMRFVEGTDLRRLLTMESRLEDARALAILARVADALDTAHSRGLVHRDVKPSNILLDEREHPYLADFGLTRRLDDPASPGAGLSAGTPAYVAPEQIRGEAVDGRADQYALACMLVECITGAPPFRRASDVALLYAHLEENPAPTGKALDPVVARALSKDPARRYESCGELVLAAREALGITEQRSRTWPLAAAVITVAVIGAALLAFLLIRADGTRSPETTGRLVRIDPSSNSPVDTMTVGNEPRSLAIGRSGVWVANREDATLWRVDPRTGDVELRVSAQGTPAEIAVDAARVYVAAGPVEAKIAVIDPATGQQQDLFPIARGSFFGSPSVAATGSEVWVATGDRQVGRLNLLTGILVDPIVLPQPPAERADAMFSGIAVGAGSVWVVGDILDHTMWRIDRSSGRLAATIPLPFAPTDVAAGLGAVWVTSRLDDTVSRIEPSTNEITATIPVGRGASGVATGAGSVWVAQSTDGTVARMDPATLDVHTIDVEGYPADVAASGDAVWVASQVVDRVDRSDAFTIGVLAACDGTYGDFAPVSFAGAELPLLERGATLAGSEPEAGLQNARVGGRDVELAFACSDDSADEALAATRRLVEVLDVDVVVGSYFFGESIAVREYAKRHPETTFVGAVGAGQSVTLHDPAPNLFRFLTDAAQWQAGLGRYAYERLGWRSVVTVGDLRSFQFTETSGFVAEFCSLGGTVARQIWVPLGTADRRPFIAQVPRTGVDGFFVAAEAPTALAFFAGVRQLRGRLGNSVIGTLPLTLPPVAETLGKRLDGVVIGGPGTPSWELSAKYATTFPDLTLLGTTFGLAYADGVEAVLRALEAVDADLADHQRHFQAALANVELGTSREDHVRLDQRRQAVGATWLGRIQTEGRFPTKSLKTIENVEQTFNGYFDPSAPAPSTNTIPCKRGNPPPWARG
jgi:YVTN family beta-propeller protein